MQGHIRVGILEDHQIFRESLVMLFQGAGMEVVAHSRDVEGFLDQILLNAPDVVLVDLRLEGSDSKEVGNGLRLVEALRERHPRTQALVLSAYQERPLMERCLRAGAVGYLCKLEVGCAGLVAAVEQVARGERIIPRELLGPLGAPTADHGAPMEQLTHREREVLDLVADGSDNLQISVRLGITERTVKARVSNLYRKLGAGNRVEMAVMARRSGVLLPPTPITQA